MHVETNGIAACPQLMAIIDFLANGDQVGEKAGCRFHYRLTGIELKRLNPPVRN